MDAIQTTGMSILDHPQAEILLADARLTPASVRGCQDRLEGFLSRYLPLFYRVEQRVNATLVIRGLLSGLERKTCEPIARAHEVERKPVQFFVGSGKWDDEAVMGELRSHVAEELGDPNAVLVMDASTFAKKGAESCGVQRQWSGRLGKLDNCQAGVFLAYAAVGGHAPLDRRLYLPKEWADDEDRREKCHVPATVVFQEKWRIALKMIADHGEQLPHGWVAGDDEFGRCAELRQALRARGERYVLDVPCNTLIRDLKRRPPRRKSRGPKRQAPFERVDRWTIRQKPSRWQRVEVRDGEKGPLQVDVLTTSVRAREDQRVGEEERLVVIRTVESKPRISYELSNAAGEVDVSELARVHCERHRIEQIFQEAKGEAGLGHYEVRSWVGWHHHMTLSLVALWFLILERNRIGGKNTGYHHGTDPTDLYLLAS